MKRLAIGFLLAAQVMSSAQPAFAADLADRQEVRAGSFGGLTLRVSLGGSARQERVRAGLTLAPTLRSRSGDGAMRTRIGEGLELGYRPNRPLSLSLAGRDLGGRRLGAAQDDEHRDTVPRVALAVGAIAVTLGLLYWGFSEAIDCDAEEECS